MVVKVNDELTKNHQEIGPKIAGVMPENKTDLKSCPVRSYIMYNEHLNPENEFMWQTPLKKVNISTDVVWYGKNHIGKNPLAKFMSEVSKNCDLSKIYTNHCIRVTGASILTRMKFSCSEIMSVTCHKSVQSLAIYQKTRDTTKKEMGSIIGQAMNTRDENLQCQLPPPHQPLALPPPQQIPNEHVPTAPVTAVANKENSTNAIVPFEANFEEDQAVPQFDLGQLIADVMNEPPPPPKPSTTPKLFQLQIITMYQDLFSMDVTLGTLLLTLYQNKSKTKLKQNKKKTNKKNLT